MAWMMNRGEAGVVEITKGRVPGGKSGVEWRTLGGEGWCCGRGGPFFCFFLGGFLKKSGWKYL